MTSSIVSINKDQ